MGQYKTFKLGDAKRHYKVLGNLVNKMPLATLHCAGFNCVVFYGSFGIFNLIETMAYGLPYGMESQDEKYKRIRNSRRFGESQKSKYLIRAQHALEMTAHWTQSTIHIVFPIFLCSSCALFVAHRSYWRSLYMRMSKPP